MATPLFKRIKTDVYHDKTVFDISFNSKSASEFCQLSNFYGGVEANYMKERFLDPEVKQLIESFETVNSEQFLYYLKELQPQKKNWTTKQEEFWYRHGIPITGILSKLAGGAVKDTPSMRKRLKILGSLAGIDHIPKIKQGLNNDEKLVHMMECLKQKYRDPHFKSLLLLTGNRLLHEKPMRGKGNFWTYPGEDHLGKCLIQIRKNLLS